MGLNIKLFVHGVPMGQKTWGPNGEDSIYLSSFYGPKWDVPEVMKVDVMTFGGITYCYYSFVKGQKVLDCQGRAGSYFALTLRINAFYADIQNMYGILKAAYDKMCVGLCVTEAEGSVKFLCSDFQNIDAKIKDIESHIIKYVSEFSISEDIISFNRLTIESKGFIKNINLHECTRGVAVEQIRRSGKLMVSPWYLSANAAKTIDRQKDEMQEIIARSQQEIQLQKEAFQDKINTLTRRHQDEIKEAKALSEQHLSEVREDGERKIADIKRHYADADIKMASLNQTLKERNREISEWKSLYQKKDKELQSNSFVVQKLEQQVSDLKRDIKDLRKEGGAKVGLSSKPRKPINRKLIGLVSFFIILLVGLLVWFFLHKSKPQKQEVQNHQDETEQLKAERDGSTRDSPYIGVLGLSQGDDTIKIGKLYRIEIQNKNIEANGTITSEEFTIQDSTFMAKREFKDSVGKISYRINGKEVAYRKFKIKE